MATIERKPLPPRGWGTTTIAPTERIDLANRARDVTDYYGDLARAPDGSVVPAPLVCGRISKLVGLALSTTSH